MNIKIPKEVLQKASQQASKILKPSVEKSISQEFEMVKKEMIAEFMNHPVTEEIMNGKTSSNISNTLGGIEGNLFSFIGFEEQDSPIIPIIDVLEKTSINFITSNNLITIANIALPSAESIFRITPMPWASGRSWAKGIESGISGLGFYIQKYGQGRSDGGVQLSKQVKSGRFRNTPYISSLLNKYTKIFGSIDLKKIKIEKI